MIAIKVSLKEKVITYDEMIYFLTGAKAGFNCKTDTR